MHAHMKVKRDQLKYGTYLTQKVFILVSSLQLLWWSKAHFLTAALIISSMKRVRSKEYRHISSTTEQRVKRTSQPKFSHVILLRTEKIPSFDCTCLLPGIYLLFQNLFRNNSEFVLLTSHCHTFLCNSNASFLILCYFI
jgi:hypothetical protein